MGSVWSLRGRAGFNRVRAEGRAARGDGVAVRILSLDDELPVRLGMAVGRAVGNAVQRNLIRRRIRAIVAEAGSALRGTAVTVSAYPGASDLSYAELRRTLRSALRSSLRHAVPSSNTESLRP